MQASAGVDATRWFASRALLGENDFKIVSAAREILFYKNTWSD